MHSRFYSTVRPVAGQLKDAIKYTVPNPLLIRTLPRATRWYAEIMTWYTCGRHYSAPIVPTEIIKINPDTVTSRMTSKTKSVASHSDMICEVIGGDWDKHARALSEYDLYNGLVDRFENGVAWESTEFYQSRVESIRSGKTKWGCSNADELKTRLSKLDDLYQNIRNNGYATQSEIRQKKLNKPAHYRSNEYLYPEFHEVIVNVGRDGEFILHDGRHRLVIAQILGLQELPVRIKLRHKQWQLIRDEALSSSTFLTEYRNHPDIRLPTS